MPSVLEFIALIALVYLLWTKPVREEALMLMSLIFALMILYF